MYKNNSMVRVINIFMLGDKYHPNLIFINRFAVQCLVSLYSLLCLFTLVIIRVLHIQ